MTRMCKKMVLQESVKEHDVAMCQLSPTKRKAFGDTGIRKAVKLAADAKPASKQPALPKQQSGGGADGRRLPGEWDALAKAIEEGETEDPKASAAAENEASKMNGPNVQGRTHYLWASH